MSQKDMGNCATVCKNNDAIDMNLSAQIQSPTKKNIARKECSIAELGSRRQPSSTEQEISFRDLSLFSNVAFLTFVFFFFGHRWIITLCRYLTFIIAWKLIYSCFKHVQLKCAFHFYAGNTEEKFFDSIQWLESDSEDFFSVNGGEIFPNFVETNYFHFPHNNSIAKFLIFKITSLLLTKLGFIQILLFLPEIALKT